MHGFKNRWQVSAFGTALTLCASLASCSGGGGMGDSDPGPTVSIQDPTSAATYSTVWTDLRLGGTVSGANFVHARNATTDLTIEGLVIYVEGDDIWYVDLPGLAPGDNPITVTASAGGSSRTATARITVVRPSQPINLIFNGADQASATTYWTGMNSSHKSHKIALFQDGTGRSTTGAAHSENAGPVAGFTWSMLGPDSIQILNCATCSFQRLSRISGSLAVEQFYGQIDTIGELQYITIHVFAASSGVL